MPRSVDGESWAENCRLVRRESYFIFQFDASLDAKFFALWLGNWMRLFLFFFYEFVWTNCCICSLLNTIRDMSNRNIHHLMSPLIVVADWVTTRYFLFVHAHIWCIYIFLMQAIIVRIGFSRLTKTDGITFRNNCVPHRKILWCSMATQHALDTRALFDGLVSQLIKYGHRT